MHRQSNVPSNYYVGYVTFIIYSSSRIIYYYNYDHAHNPNQAQSEEFDIYSIENYCE